MKEKAINLYEYLRHLVQLRMSVVLDAEQYVDMIWIDD